jgi:hypothetical protein
VTRRGVEGEGYAMDMDMDMDMDTKKRARVGARYIGDGNSEKKKRQGSTVRYARYGRIPLSQQKRTAKGRKGSVVGVHRADYGYFPVLVC